MKVAFVKFSYSAGYVKILTSIDVEREFIRVLGYQKFGLEFDEILLIIQDFKLIASTIEML